MTNVLLILPGHFLGVVRGLKLIRCLVRFDKEMSGLGYDIKLNQ